MPTQIHNENIALNQALWEFQNDKNIDVVIRRASRNGVTYWIYSDDREKTKVDVFNALSTNKAGKLSEQMTNMSAMPAIICTQKGNFKLTFIFKPKKGGMSQTTLNSSVTELFPCIAFNNGISPSMPNDKFYQAIVKANNSAQTKGGPYLTDKDAKAGTKFIQQADPKGNPTLQTKITNAKNITRWLLAHNRYHPIIHASWGYRAKPPGVPNNHPGDIFIKYKSSGGLLGISLKAGGVKTDEPKLNTYVKPIFDFFGQSNAYDNIKDKLWPQYMQIPGIQDSDKRKWGNRDLALKTYEYEKTNPREYEALYDQNLAIIKGELINLFNSHPKKAKKWMEENIANIGFDVPVILVKATDRSAGIDKSGNLLVEALAASDKINARLPKTSKSKQAFEIILEDGMKVQLNFTASTNKVGAMHKMGQFSNLAVKFNKVKKA